ncbi:MAG: DUF1800 domain-containing protein [Candidatus Hydrogenedentota bacterium]
MPTNPLKPLPPQRWDAEHAKHLLSRAGFGVPRDRVTHLAQIGSRKAVDALVDFDRVPQYGEHPQFLIPAGKYRDLRKIKDENERRQARNVVRKEERQSVDLLKQWWLERMLNSPRPLEEKMTLFWHGHFATSAQKIKNSEVNYTLHDTLRRHATGNFKELTLAVAQSPAMLRYLDNTQNVKEHPNENWARELMELFTLGIGNYTEDDIKESARAFSGWAIGRKGYVFNEKKHDFGSKTFLGHTGNFDGDEILAIIFEQDAAATFLCTKLYKFFVNDTPDERVINAMANEMRAYDYHVEPVLRKLFLSKHFYDEANRGNQIKSPIHFIVQLTHDLNMKYPPYQSMARASAQLGQNLFYPPNVKGWDGGRAWINANTLLTRYNLPVTLASANGQREMMTMEQNMAPEMDQQTMRAERQEEIKTYVRSLPEKKRVQFHKKMRNFKTPAERAKFVRATLEKRRNYETWNTAEVFDALRFTTVDECIDALQEQFLTAPLATEQRAILAKTLAADEPFTRETLTPDAMNATLHLLLSTAEYQLT